MISGIVFVTLTLVPGTVFGYTIQSTSAPIRGDFVLEPAKVELFMAPGDTTETEFRLVNRTDEALTFSITIEDTKGSDDASRSVILLGDEDGPYPLRDMVMPEITEFTLKSQEEIRLPVTVAIPSDAAPGGRYGSVLFESRSVGGADTGSRTVSRLGALLFVRIEGDVKEEGQLEQLRVKGGSQIFFNEDPIAFEFTYRNTGSVHLNPYGILQIKNVLGVMVDELEILPYFAMPESLRSREVTWEHGTLLGFYTAELSQNRGYDDIIDTKSVYFLVLPWKEMAIGIVIIIILALLARWFFTTFEFKKKK
jgi:hypothetical protein